MELREGSVVLEVELNNGDDIDSVASDSCDELDMVTRVDVVVISLIGNRGVGLPFAVDVGVEDEVLDTESILLASLPDDSKFGALAAVLCPPDLEDEAERLDKLDCTDELYDEEEELTDVRLTDKGEVKEPLK